MKPTLALATAMVLVLASPTAFAQSTGINAGGSVGGSSAIGSGAMGTTNTPSSAGAGVNSSIGAGASTGGVGVNTNTGAGVGNGGATTNSRGTTQ